MNILNFIDAERPAASNMMPGLQASAAAGRAGMLGHKNRMAGKRGLASVIRHRSRSQSPADKLTRMITDDSHAALRDIVSIPFKELET